MNIDSVSQITVKNKAGGEGVALGTSTVVMNNGISTFDKIIF
jgi:hypothetical protein